MPAIQLRNTILYWESVGEGPPLILIAGLGASLTSWGSLGRLLGRRFRTILYDQRGIGRSSAYGGDYSLSLLAGDLRELADALEFPRFHIVGASLGGMVAMRFAIDHPDRVGRLVLVSTRARTSPYTHRVGEIIGMLARRCTPSPPGNLR